MSYECQCFLVSYGHLRHISLHKVSFMHDGMHNAYKNYANLKVCVLFGLLFYCLPLVPLTVAALVLELISLMFV